MENDIELLKLFGLIYKKVWKVLNPLIRDMQMSATDMLVLLHLIKKQPCRATELASLIGIPTSTLTGIADRLEAGGFLSREHDEDDRRSIIMKVTPKVRQVIDDKKKALGEILKEMFRFMPADRKKQLAEDLHIMLDSMERATGDQAK